MSFDATTSVEDKYNQALALWVEIRMLLDMGSPIRCCLFGSFTQLHFFWCRTFPKRDDFPLLRLVWKLDRFYECVRRLRWRRFVFDLDDVFSRVHCFAFRSKERACSLHHARESGPLRNETPSVASALSGGGARSNGVPREVIWNGRNGFGVKTNVFVSWRDGCAEQPEAREWPRMNTTEMLPIDVSRDAEDAISYR